MIIASHKALGLATLVKFLTLYRSSHWLSTQGPSLFQAFEASEAMSLPLINFTESHLYCYLQIGSIEWDWLTRKAPEIFQSVVMRKWSFLLIHLRDFLTVEALATSSHVSWCLLTTQMTIYFQCLRVLETGLLAPMIYTTRRERTGHLLGPLEDRISHRSVNVLNHDNSALEA